MKICTAYRDPDGKIVRHVLRNEEYRRSSTPIYEEIPSWAEDISSVRSFQNLPIEAQRYVAVMVRSTLDIAYPNGYLETLPHVRFVGIGPMPGQILRDLPATEDLVQGST